MKFAYCCEKTHTIDGIDYNFKPEGDRFTCEVKNEDHIKLFIGNDAFSPINAKPVTKKNIPRKQGTRRSRSVSDYKVQSDTAPKR